MTFDTCEQFLDAVFRAAHAMGYARELGKDGWQIGLGGEVLHEGHLAEMYPDILEPGTDVSFLIGEIAPGRDGAHEPMREIIEKIQKG